MCLQIITQSHFVMRGDNVEDKPSSQKLSAELDSRIFCADVEHGEAGAVSLWSTESF